VGSARRDGPAGNKPIHVYGPPNLGAGAITYFQARVFGGGEMWNEDLREYADRTQMIADLSRDPLGIAYAPLASGNAGVKALRLAETKAGPYVALKPRECRRPHLPAAPAGLYLLHHRTIRNPT